MAVQFLESFEIYGTGSTGDDRLVDGVYAEVNTLTSAGISAPAFGARTGQYAYFAQGPAGSSAFYYPLRRVLTTPRDTLFSALGVYFPFLPANNDRARIMVFRTAANAILAYLTVEADGSLTLRDSGGSALATTSGPAVSTGAWNYVEMKFVRDASAGAFELRVNETVVINASALNTGASAVGQVSVECGGLGLAGTSGFWVDDWLVYDDTGGYNNNFLGDQRIATIFPNEDVANNWASNYRQRFGAGILYLDGATDGVSMADAAALNLGSGDYTLEGQVRFESFPDSADKAVLFAQWDNTIAAGRGWELYKGGASVDGGNLVFAYTTDGTAGTLAKPISYAWQPELYRWYHVAITRTGGTAYLFIDGLLVATGADSATYYDASVLLTLGGEIDGGNIEAGTEFNGWMDEVRWTVGVARYTADFTAPTAAFPRSAPGDPDFASVQLLCGFEGSITDESSAARTLTAEGGGEDQEPGDAAAHYLVVNTPLARDDTFVEAEFTFATGELTLTANPTASETVTVGSQTYTFVAALTGADDVLIGADLTESRDNLVAAINNDAGEGTTYGTGTLANTSATAGTRVTDVMTLQAIAQGTAGNSVATTETLTNGSFDNATLTGGADIPGVQEFGLESLPPDTTGVSAVAMITRQRKSDSGSCQTQVSFVGSGGAAGAGSDRPITTADTFYQDIIEEDPDTTAGLTPTSLVGANLRINRTV